MANTDYITRPEFQAWWKERREEEDNFRLRLETRLHGDHQETLRVLERIETQTRETNGRLRDAEQVVAVLGRDVAALRDEDLEIERVVTKIDRDGCGKLHDHAAIIEDAAAPAGMSRKRKALLAGGIAAGGAVGWTVLYELIKLGTALVQHHMADTP